MTVLERVNLGSEPDGKGGDTNRSAFNKLNANLEVIERTAPLDMAFLNDSADLTPDHVGKRFGLWMADAGKVIGMPLAASVRPNSCIHLFNVQQTVSIKFQAGDMSQLVSLNTGDWVTYVSDGVKIWHVAARGKMMPDEVVSGSLTVSGDIRAAQSSDEGHLYLGKMPGYFYGNSGSVGWWSPDSGGSYQYRLSDHTFRVDDQVVYHEGNFDPSIYMPRSGGKFGGDVLVSTFLTGGPLSRSGGIGSAMKGTMNPRGVEANVQLWMESRTNFLTYAILAVDGWQDTRYFRFEESGNAVAPGAWTSYSDRRLKKDIRPIEDGTKKLAEITGCTFEKLGQRQAGVIAQDLEKVLPEGVYNTGTYSHPNGDEVHDCLSISSDAVIALLVQAVNELRERVEKLEGGVENAGC
ncbi:tail fiber domain-containing protein [Burkholderia pseudomallei]|uniref:tail fiber domain-containing protein n=1 Tax=Burkholderia pseudomallei TaxID=28450 RepID=UPI000977BC50|nr:Phage-related tail fiber protein [Burkholderia pseudomallei]